MEASWVSHHQKIQNINQLWETDGDCVLENAWCFCCTFLHLMNQSILRLIRPLSKNLRAVRRKSPQMSDKTALLHDNARPHTAHVTGFFGRGWEILEHPPYSPDLAPSNFHLFPTWKNIFVPSNSKHIMSAWGANMAAWSGSHLLPTGFWEIDFPPRQVPQKRWL
jgi:hypothetical protein